MIEEVWIFLSMLLLSAFFSGSETALLSLSPVNVVKGHASRLTQLYQIKENLITTCLIGNNITIIAATLALKNILKEEEDLITKTLALTAEILIFFFISEMLPKAITRKLDNRFLSSSWFVLKFFYWLLWPVSVTFVRLNMGLRKILPGEKTFASQDVYAFIEHHVDKETTLPAEWIELKTTKAKEWMTPLSDFVSLDANEIISKVMDLVEKTSYSRYPVYQNRGDHIIGYVSVFDFLFAKKTTKISHLIKRPVFVPENLSSEKVWQKMQKEKVPIVFVVNEYGSVQGLISLEDIGEHFIGEIIVEEQVREKAYIKKVSKYKFLLDGNLDIDDFNKEFSANIVKQGFETITGLIIDTLGYIPRKNKSFHLQGYNFMIAEANDRTINKVYFLVNQDVKNLSQKK